MNIAVLTNIATPYRTHFFDVLHEEVNQAGGDFRVFYMGDTEVGRPWRYPAFARPYTERLPGVHPRVKGVTFHTNWSVTSTLRRFGPDVILVAGAWLLPTNILVQLTRPLLRKPVTIFWSESHSRERRSQSKLIAKISIPLRRLIYESYDAIAVPGQFAEEHVRGISEGDTRFIALPNVVDGTFYSQAAKRWSEQSDGPGHSGESLMGRLNMVIPARMIEKKGIRPFLEHLASDPSLSERVSVTIAGDGPEEESIRALVSRNSHLDVRMTGQVSPNAIVDLYADSDCFVLPSLADPNPLSVIEALWAGMPLLLSDKVGNWPECLVEDENGFVFDPESRASTLEGISRLLDKDGDWHARAHACSVRIAEERFDSGDVARSLIRECAGLISKKA